MPDLNGKIETFAGLQNFVNFDGSGTSLSTAGFKPVKGVTLEQSIGKDWTKSGQISYKGVTDLKTSAKLADAGAASINFSSRSRFTYNDDNSAFAQRISVGADVPITKDISFYFTPNSTTTLNFKTGKISEPTLSVYSGVNTKFKLYGQSCSLMAEGQAYDLIHNPAAKSKTGFNLIFKMNF